MKQESPIVARLWRGAVCEAEHRAYAVAVDEAGSVLWSAGEPDHVTTMRSAAKPLQLVPLVESGGADELSEEEIAVCCASHPGEPRHSALAASVLALSGFLPDHLICGPPADHPSPIRHGCSGNHAGILLLAKKLGAPLDTYYRPDHPAQKLIAGRIRELAGADEVAIGVDGCGIPTFGLRMREMARAYAVLSRPGAPWSRIPTSMRHNPELLGPETRIDCRLIKATDGVVYAKTGAEGLLCLGRDGQGMAIKILDGNARALGAVAVECLLRTGWIGPEEAGSSFLAIHRRPELPSPTDDHAAEIRVDGDSYTQSGTAG